MTTFQKVVKYIAIGIAIFLIVCIVGGLASVTGIIGGFIRADGVTDELKNYTVSNNVISLEIEIGAADFKISEADSFSLESNLKYLKVEESDGILKITETEKIGKSYNDAILNLYIPKDFEFETVKIAVGASKLAIDKLSTNTVYMELGAGAVHIDELNATTNAIIEGGAGKLVVGGGALCNLNLDMGVGKCDLTSSLTGKTTLNYGLGEGIVTVLGDKNDYKLTIDKGIGDVLVEGQSVQSGAVIGNGANTIDIDSGIGSVKVSFRDA